MQRIVVNALSLSLFGVMLSADVNAEPDGRGPARWRENRGENVAARFDRMDADGDGKISHDEFLKPREKMFKKLDQNGDGALDAGEQKAIMERFGGAGGEAPGAKKGRSEQREE